MSDFNSSSSCDMVSVCVFVAGTQSSSSPLGFWLLKPSGRQSESRAAPRHQSPTKRPPFGTAGNLSTSYLFLPNQHSWSLPLTASVVIC